MKKVYKYPLAADPGVVQTITLTGPDATPLSVGIQGKQIVVWVLEQADPGPHGYLSLMLTWTGNPAPLDAKFVGTVITPDGLVWHLWTLSY